MELNISRRRQLCSIATHIVSPGPFVYIYNPHSVEIRTSKKPCSVIFGERRRHDGVAEAAIRLLSQSYVIVSTPDNIGC